MTIRATLLVLVVWAAATPRQAWAEPGLVGSWSFDEGRGDIAHDGSGRGNHGALHHGHWIPRGAGHALALDGETSYVDCGAGPSLDLRAALTLEAWIKPTGSPAAEPVIFGKHHEYYGITMYRANGCWFYISSGGNNVHGVLELDAWNHVVGTFDGATMTLYINRVKVAARQSQVPTIKPGKNFVMGVSALDPTAADLASPQLPHWKGELDDVRVFERALTETEVQQRYKETAGGYGVDTSGFDRLKMAWYPFRAARRMVVALDYGGIFPRPQDAVLDASIVRPGDPKPLLRQSFASLPATDLLSVLFDLSGLPAGDFAVRAELTGPSGFRVAAEEDFRYPLAEPAVPAPSQWQVAPLPPPAAPPAFTVDVGAGGGFTIQLKGRQLPVVSHLSYPNAGQNVLADTATGEPDWQVERHRVAADCWQITARGKSYTWTRKLRIFANRVSVQDTVTNRTTADVGVIVDNGLDASAVPFERSHVAGYPGGGRRSEAESPSAFVAWPDCGLGIVPLDDVYVVQSTCYAEAARAGVLTDKFGLAAGTSYTLEWAVYPTDTPDYYEFINRVRKDEGRTGTVAGGFAFVPQTPPISADYAKLRNLSYASFSCLCNVADDPEIEIEGLEFMWLPKERARLRERFQAIRQIHPQLKLMFHIAHSLVTTNRPAERFPDARVLNPDGSQVVYPADYANTSYFSPRRRQEGYKWYIFYPMPGNTFHDLLLDSVDVLLDDIGANGAFMDGFLFGYGSRYIDDQWDGHTVQIDPQQYTVTRRTGSVVLLSQPSMVEFTRRMVARGATVIANGVIMTRTIGKLPIVTDQECTSGPITHLAQTPTALGDAANIKGETAVYRDALDKLSWGLLYFYYGEGALTYPSLPQQSFPITVEEIHAGTIVGKERIVTMKSGVYGWTGDDALHYGYRYNPLGAQVAADFLTTVAADSVRTDVQLAARESAVIKRIPVTLTAPEPVNLLCEQYDADRIALLLNGQGPVELLVRNGEFAVQDGRDYCLGGVDDQIATASNGTLKLKLNLRGPTRVVMTPAD